MKLTETARLVLPGLTERGGGGANVQQFLFKNSTLKIAPT